MGDVKNPFESTSSPRLAKVDNKLYFFLPLADLFALKELPFIEEKNLTLRAYSAFCSAVLIKLEEMASLPSELSESIISTWIAFFCWVFAFGF